MRSLLIVCRKLLSIASVSCVACLTLLSSVQADDFNILMIGNSYVQGNSSARDVSLDVQGLLSSDPNHTGNVTKRAVSAWSLKTHAESTTTTDFITDSGTYLWDAIVLQEQSNRPGRAIKFSDSQLTNLDLGGPILIDLIKLHQPQAKVVLFNSWSKYPGHSDLIQYFNDDVEEMLSFTNQGYDRIQENTGSWDHTNVATIARVGDAWDQWYDTHSYANSSARLHRGDGTHQNDRGSYLAASVIYEQITGSSTVGNTYAGAVTGRLGGDSIVSLLQQQATDITGVGLVDTADFDSDLDIDGRDLLTWQIGFGLTGTAELAEGDANHDDQVNASDLSIWRQQFGTTPSSVIASRAIPEPSGFAILTMLAVGSLIQCRPVQKVCREE